MWEKLESPVNLKTLENLKTLGNLKTRYCQAMPTKQKKPMEQAVTWKRLRHCVRRLP